MVPGLFARGSGASRYAAIADIAKAPRPRKFMSMKITRQALFPKSILGKVMAAVWLMACIAVLVFGFVQRDIDDMPIAFIWFMIFLTFPIGAAALVALGVMFGVLDIAFGISYHPFWDELPLWFISVALGYWQWFLLIPRSSRNRNVSAKEH